MCARWTTRPPTTAYRRQVQANPAEVSEVAFVELPDLTARMAAEPDTFTQWFRDEAALLKDVLFDGRN